MKQGEKSLGKCIIMPKKKNWGILLFGLFAFTTVFAYFNFWGLYENIALSGFSPIHYTHLKLFPQNFVSNFTSGVEHYDKSLMMALYPLLGKYLHIPPEMTLKGVMILEYIALFMTSFFLLKALRPQSGSLEIFTLWFVFCSSYGMDVNIANFGFFLQGQFYNFALLFAIIGILSCLKDRFILAAFSLMLTLLIHSTMGLMAIFLVLFTFLPFPNRLFQKRLLLPFSLLGIGVVIWCGWIVLQSHTGSGTIPQDLWVSMTRMGNYHWYPYHLGFFTGDPWEFFIPFLCFLLLLIHYFPLKKDMTEVDNKIVFVFLGALFLTILGVFISVFLPYPFLIKLALHRASLFILFFGWPYLVWGIYQDIKEGSILQKALALTTLLFPFLQRPSIFMILPTLFLTYSTIKKSFQNPSFSEVRSWVIWLILGIFLFLLVLMNYGDFAALKVFLIKAVGRRWWEFFFVIFVVFQLLHFLKIKNFALSDKLMPFFSAMVLLYGIAIFQKGRLPSHDEFARGQDYIETQIWVKNNTPNTALFMVDPTIHYGWRDFSQRSSFGNSREWVHVSWLYDSDEHIFREGMRRFSLFKLPIENYLTGFFPVTRGHHKLTADVENAFYNFDEKWFENVQRIYGIHYVVMQKEKLKKQYAFPIVFENQRFVVFHLPKMANNTQLGN